MEENNYKILEGSMLDILPTLQENSFDSCITDPPYEGKTEEGKKWSGYGTCLKPAYEPIIIARKPIEKSVAENVLKYGCGAINIDECRVGNETVKEGRFPSNVILTYDETDFDEVCGGMPYTKSNGIKITMPKMNSKSDGINIYNFGKQNAERVETDYIPPNDEGSASRYFYCAKASKKDRDEGLDMFEEKQSTDGCIRANSETARMFGANSISKKNIHPTVKPIDLMQYLVRMFTPKGGQY